jgi:hypothetical protein
VAGPVHQQDACLRGVEQFDATRRSTVIMSMTSKSSTNVSISSTNVPDARAWRSDTVSG